MTKIPDVDCSYELGHVRSRLVVRSVLHLATFSPRTLSSVKIVPDAADSTLELTLWHWHRKARDKLIDTSQEAAASSIGALLALSS